MNTVYIVIGTVGFIIYFLRTIALLFNPKWLQNTFFSKGISKKEIIYYHIIMMAIMISITAKVIARL
ncbi:MAG: hypothetical protein LC134_02120 [Chitinophagales bacterium]|nr:hypothetical protein [Chitinophagales bacterium]